MPSAIEVPVIVVVDRNKDGEAEDEQTDDASSYGSLASTAACLVSD
jgi:hypothetical protein